MVATTKTTWVGCRSGLVRSTFTRSFLSSRVSRTSKMTMSPLRPTPPPLLLPLAIPTCFVSLPTQLNPRYFFCGFFAGAFCRTVGVRYEFFWRPRWVLRVFLWWGFGFMAREGMGSSGFWVKSVNCGCGVWVLC